MAVRSLHTFAAFARRVAARADTYRTTAACRMMVARLRKYHSDTGSYGCVAGELDAAVQALLWRWMELDAVAADERRMALYAAATADGV